MKNIARNIFVLFFSFCSFFANAIEWPQKDVSYDSFHSFFAGLRGQQISTSLVFQDAKEVNSCMEGNVICDIQESQDVNFFDSTLGNAIITATTDNMLITYSNLDSQSTILPQENMQITQGQPIGQSGNSGFQEGRSGLEFMISNTRQRTAVNPRILFPHLSKDISLNIEQLCIIDKEGKVFDFRLQRNFLAGVYLLYKERQDIAVPFKTEVYINGVIAETLVYDALHLVENRLCLCGKKNYPVEVLYPDSQKQLLGEINLSKGHNTITVTVQDILGNKKTTTYNIDCL